MVEARPKMAKIAATIIWPVIMFLTWRGVWIKVLAMIKKTVRVKYKEVRPSQAPAVSAAAK